MSQQSVYALDNIWLLYSVCWTMHTQTIWVPVTALFEQLSKWSHWCTCPFKSWIKCSGSLLLWTVWMFSSLTQINSFALVPEGDCCSYRHVCCRFGRALRLGPNHGRRIRRTIEVTSGPWALDGKRSHWMIITNMNISICSWSLWDH